MMISWAGYLCFLFGLAWAFVGLFRWYAIDKGMIDEPNARSSHIAPTPRGGGVIFFLGWTALVGILGYYHMISQNYLWLFLPAFLIGLIGLWDDHRDLSALTRLLLQFAIACSSLYIMDENGQMIRNIHSFTLPLPVCFGILALGIVWMINLFNFMDGSDGIATSEAMFVFGVGGYFLYQQNAFELAILAWGLVALLAGFLTWNWPTARIFMGDCGSTFLGCLVAIYAIASYKFFHVSLVLWVILTGVFWFDATMTLLRRIIAGEDWRKPHRLHTYQRLIQAGWSHQQVLLGSIAANGVLGLMATIAYLDPRLEYFALSFSVIFLFCIYLLVEMIKPMYRTWHSDSFNS